MEANRKALEASLGQELREYSLAEVEDYAYRLRETSFEEGVSQAIQNLPDEVQRYIWNEIHLAKIDFRYWANRYCYVLADDKRLRPLSEFWPGQEKLLSLIAEEELKQWEKGLPPKIRIALLKSRQVGGTAISEALGAHMCFLQPNTQGVIGADHPDITLKLWQTLLRMHQNLPGWMRPIPDSKPKATNLHFPDLDSDIMYGSGNQRTTLGQGITIDFAHLTEVSTWEYPNYLDEDLLPAFDSSRKHHSLVVLESTGHGARGNWFHDVFMAAWKKQNLFKAQFVGWYLRPSWSMDPEGIEIDEETKKLTQRVLEEQGVELSKEQMAWWQVKRKAAEAENKLEIFYQEFPSTMDEAFQSGFRSVFPISLRSSLRRAVKKPEDVYDYNQTTKKLKKLDVDEFWRSEDATKWENRFIVWERKRPGYVYVVGVDASHGIDGGDNAAIEVLRVGNKYRQDEQVAEWCGNVDPLILADIAWIVGHVYCEAGSGFPAKLAIEVNPGSPGIVTQTALMKRQYPHFYRWRRPLRADGRYSNEVGWWTTPGTRPLLTERGVHTIVHDEIWLNSPEFIREMGTFVNTGIDKGKKYLEAAPGEHDDRIMALFIALEVAHADDLVNIAEQRRQMQEQRDAPKPEVRQFNEILTPYDELLQQWEDQVVDMW